MNEPRARVNAQGRTVTCVSHSFFSPFAAFALLSLPRTLLAPPVAFLSPPLLFPLRWLACAAYDTPVSRRAGLDASRRRRDERRRPHLGACEGRFGSGGVQGPRTPLHAPPSQRPAGEHSTFDFLRAPEGNAGAKKIDLYLSHCRRPSVSLAAVYVARPPHRLSLACMWGRCMWGVSTGGLKTAPQAHASALVASPQLLTR